MGKIFFVTGIDTDCGKTVATGAMAKAYMDLGYKVITVKLVQSGCEGLSEDIAEHRKLMGVDLLPEDLNGTTCPYVLQYPSSPHLAARLEQIKIDLKKVQDNIEYLSSQYDIIFVEGAGGLMVPIHDDYSILDYLKDKLYSTILVSSSKLGSINHTLLSVEVCRKYNIPLVGICYNHVPGENELILKDNLNVFKRYMKNHTMNIPFIELPKLEGTSGVQILGDIETFLHADERRVK